METAIVFCLDEGNRVITSREVRFTTRAELIHQIEPDLPGCATVEAWQESVCVLRMKAHGQIEWNAADGD